MTNATSLSYPSKSFLGAARDALSRSAPFEIRVNSGIRGFLVRKSLSCWPRREGEPANWQDGSGRWFALCMNVCAGLMTIHFRSLSSGRRMLPRYEGDTIYLQYLQTDNNQS
jgi:hypothetical protein